MRKIIVEIVLRNSVARHFVKKGTTWSVELKIKIGLFSDAVESLLEDFRKLSESFLEVLWKTFEGILGASWQLFEIFPGTFW